MPPLDNQRHERFAQELAKGKTITEASAESGFHLAPCDKPSGYYVYLLTDPHDDVVFYVGKGKGSRHRAHLREWRGMSIVNLAKHQRIGKIIKFGGKPGEMLIEDGLDEASALRLERGWIRAIGRGVLTNCVAGNQTAMMKLCEHVSDLWQRIKPFSVWVREKPRSSSDIDGYWMVAQDFSDFERDWVKPGVGDRVNLRQAWERKFGPAVQV